MTIKVIMIQVHSLFILSSGIPSYILSDYIYSEPSVELTTRSITGMQYISRNAGYEFACHCNVCQQKTLILYHQHETALMANALDF